MYVNHSAHGHRDAQFQLPPPSGRDWRGLFDSRLRVATVTAFFEVSAFLAARFPSGRASPARVETRDPEDGYTTRLHLMIVKHRFNKTPSTRRSDFQAKMAKRSRLRTNHLHQQAPCSFLRHSLSQCYEPLRISLRLCPQPPKTKVHISPHTLPIPNLPISRPTTPSNSSSGWPQTRKLAPNWTTPPR